MFPIEYLNKQKRKTHNHRPTFFNQNQSDLRLTNLYINPQNFKLNPFPIDQTLNRLHNSI